MSSAAADPGHPEAQRELDRIVSEGAMPGVLTEIHDGDQQWFVRIGSDTKTFVATVALQLVAEHKLSLDDTVEKRLPGLVTGNGNDGSKIAVRQQGRLSGSRSWCTASNTPDQKSW